MKEKVLNPREFFKLLENNGYEYISSTGDHKKYSNGKNTIVINNKPNRMVMRRLIKENNLVYSV